MLDGKKPVRVPPSDGILKDWRHGGMKTFFAGVLIAVILSAIAAFVYTTGNISEVDAANSTSVRLTTG